MNINVQPVGGATLVLGTGTRFKILTPISGLDTPPERNSTGDYSGADGGFQGAQYYSLRDVTLTGIILSPDITSHYIDRQLFLNAFPINVDLNITFIMPNGQSLYMLARRKNLTCEQDGPSMSNFKIDLLSGDPLLYDVTGGSAINVSVPIKSGGGFILPVITPIVSGAGSGPTSINNTGVAEILPLITITNSANTPVITNLTTGEFIKINVTMSNSDVLIIDMKQRTITLNGANVLAERDPTSSWWALEPGNNNIQFTTSSSGNTGVAVINYRPALVGV